MRPYDVGFGTGMPIEVYPEGEYLVTLLDDGSAQRTRRPRQAPLGLVARMQRIADLKDAARGKGPSARVAAMVLAQIKGERVRPL